MVVYIRTWQEAADLLGEAWALHFLGPRPETFRPINIPQDARTRAWSANMTGSPDTVPGSSGAV